jgi:hypothetical protein
VHRLETCQTSCLPTCCVSLQCWYAEMATYRPWSRSMMASNMCWPAAGTGSAYRSAKGPTPYLPAASSPAWTPQPHQQSLATSGASPPAEPHCQQSRAASGAALPAKPRRQRSRAASGASPPAKPHRRAHPPSCLWSLLILSPPGRYSSFFGKIFSLNV